MTKFTKITAAIVAAAAVLSFAGCSNNNASSSSASESSSAVESTASTAEAKTAEAASTADAQTAEVAAPSTAEVAAPATVEAAAFDVSVLYGDWILAAVNDGTNTMNVADFAASVGSDAESSMIYVTIDDAAYTSTAMGITGTYAYTASEDGIIVDMEGMQLPISYSAEGDFYAYGVAVGDVTYKYVFMRNTEDAASTAEAAPATAQAVATAEAAE